MRLRRQYNRAKITGTGWLFLLFIFLVSGVALNSGNNLIYLTLSVMISYFLLSGFLSVSNIQGLELHFRLPEMIFANTQGEAILELENKSKTSKFLLKVESEYFVSEFISIQPLVSARNIVNLNFKRRGLYKLHNVFVKSYFPFYFFERKVLLNTNDVPILVFPEIKNVIFENQDLESPDDFKQMKGESNEFFSSADYKEGDDKRKISWKLSARTGVEKIIEGEKEVSKSFNFFVDNSKLAYCNEEEFEIAIIKIASCVYKSFISGYDFSLSSNSENFELGNSFSNLINILSFLTKLSLKDSSVSLPRKRAITYRDVKFAEE